MPGLLMLVHSELHIDRVDVETSGATWAVLRHARAWLADPFHVHAAAVAATVTPPPAINH